MSTTENPTSPPPEKVLPAITLAAFLGTMAIVSFNAVMGPIARTLHLEEWQAGLVMTTAGVFWMLLGRRWGALSDQIGRRGVLLGALAASGSCYLLLAIAVSLAIRSPPAVWVSATMLVVLRSLIGAFHSALPPTAVAVVADETPPEMRGVAMAKLGAANSIGMVMGPAAAGWLATRSLALPMYVAASLPLLAFVLLCWRLPAQAAPRPAETRRKAASSLQLFDCKLRLPICVSLVAMLCVSVAQVSVGFYSMDRLGLDEKDGARVAGIALTCVGLGLICSQSLVMRFRGVPPRDWMALGTFVSALGFLCVTFIEHPVQLYLSYALAAFGMGFTMPAIQAFTSNVVSAQDQGIAAGTVASMQGLGTVIGPLLGTTLYGVSPKAPYLMNASLLLGLSMGVLISRSRSRTNRSEAEFS